MGLGQAHELSTMADGEAVGRRASPVRLGVWVSDVSVSALGFESRDREPRMPFPTCGSQPSDGECALWRTAPPPCTCGTMNNRSASQPSSRHVLQVAAYRRELDVRVGGFDVPRPVRTFAHCGYDADLMAAIKKAG